MFNFLGDAKAVCEEKRDRHTHRPACKAGPWLAFGDRRVPTIP